MKYASERLKKTRAEFFLIYLIVYFAVLIIISIFTAHDFFTAAEQITQKLFGNGVFTTQNLLWGIPWLTGAALAINSKRWGVAAAIIFTPWSAFLVGFLISFVWPFY